MTFANPLPLWAIALLIGAAASVAWLAYRAAPIAAGRRRALSALRFLTLLWIGLCLMRPMIASGSADASDAVVAILVDGSRSMGLADLDGMRRIDRARDVVQLLPRIVDWTCEQGETGQRVTDASPANEPKNNE